VTELDTHQSLGPVPIAPRGGRAEHAPVAPTQLLSAGVRPLP
jgi:hypothetical protein